MKRIIILTTAGAFLLGLSACTDQQQANFGVVLQAGAAGFAYGAANRPYVPVYAPVYQPNFDVTVTCTQMGMFTNCSTW